MTVQFLVTLATFLVENQNFVATNGVVEHFYHYFGTLYYRSTDGDITVIVDKENLIKFERCTDFCLCYSMDEQPPSGLGLELLSLHFYDCVHVFAIVYWFTGQARCGSQRTP